nr:MAG TPA_asm: tail protein [Caudoviricetes sp.]
MLEYTIEGFNLHQPELGFQLLEGSSYAAEIAPRRVNLEVPGVHGEIPQWNDPLSSTNMTFNVRIRDQNPLGLRQKWQYLRSLMRTGGNNPVTVRRLEEDQVTSTQMQLLSMSEPDFYCAAGMITTTIMLHNPSGRWQSINASEQQLAIPGTDQVVTVAAASSGPITDALVRVRGPVSSVVVRDNTNDTGFQWQLSPVISASQYLLVDCATYTAWRNTTDDWEQRGSDVSSGLRTIGNGMLSLVSVPSFVVGNNSNSVTVSAAGTTSNTELTILARQTHI